MNAEYRPRDVVEASDPFKPGTVSRPFVVVNTADHPFHGEQYIALTLTTKTWHEETIPLTESDFVDGALPKKSFVVPWSTNSLQDGDIETYLGRLSSSPVGEAVRTSVDYLFVAD